LNEPPRVRNPERTRRSVLDAAERLFAERGFAGTSMRDISRGSGISQPLIHHHFGTKEDLYVAVRRRVSEHYAARFPDVALKTDRPVDVKAELERFFDFLSDHGALLRLLAWAHLEGNNPMWPSDMPPMEALIARIVPAQQAGLVRKDIEAANLSIMMVGLIAHWLDNRSRYAGLFRDGYDDRAYLDQAVSLVSRGLMPDRGE
jgi:TetR/AcrR family transcriptional regulator